VVSNATAGGVGLIDRIVEALPDEDLAGGRK
jgi:hypothetical protein